jgi:hypothetical protein
MREFTIEFNGNGSAMAENAKKVANNAGAYFNGNSETGEFSGKGVSGFYRVEGGRVTVTITDKPFFAPWGLVEE